MKTTKIYIDTNPIISNNVITNNLQIQQLLNTAAKRLPYYGSVVRDIIDGALISFTADKSSIEIEVTTNPGVVRVISDISEIIGKQGEPKKEKYFRHLNFEDLPEREKPRKIVENINREYSSRMWTFSLVGLDTPQMRVNTIEDIISESIDFYPEEFRDAIIGCREHVNNLASYARQL